MHHPLRNCFLLGILCLVVMHRKAWAASVVEVGSEIKSTVEEFLKSKSKLRMDEQKPLKMNINSLPEKKKHHRLELLEEALRLIYHELYETTNITGSSNISDIISRSRAISSRQSFFSNGLNSVSEYLMSLVENSLEDLPSLPRLEAQECMKRIRTYWPHSSAFVPTIYENRRSQQCGFEVPASCKIWPTKQRKLWCAV